MIPSCFGALAKRGPKRANPTFNQVILPGYQLFTPSWKITALSSSTHSAHISHSNHVDAASASASASTSHRNRQSPLCCVKMDSVASLGILELSTLAATVGATLPIPEGGFEMAQYDRAVRNASPKVPQ